MKIVFYLEQFPNLSHVMAVWGLCWHEGRSQPLHHEPPPTPA